MSQPGTWALVSGVAAGFAIAVSFTEPVHARAESASSAAVQRAFTQFKSGLRHEDGELACSRMTLRYRISVLSKLAQEGTAGIGCVTLVEIYGREAYNEIKTKRLSKIRVNGSRATAWGIRTRLTFRLVDGRWRIDSSRIV